MMELWLLLTCRKYLLVIVLGFGFGAELSRTMLMRIIESFVYGNTKQKFHEFFVDGDLIFK